MTEKYVVQFEDRSVLHRTFSELETAKEWARNYVMTYPRPIKTSIFKQICVIQTQKNVIETEV